MNIGANINDFFFLFAFWIKLSCENITNYNMEFCEIFLIKLLIHSYLLFSKIEVHDYGNLTIILDRWEEEKNTRENFITVKNSWSVSNKIYRSFNCSVTHGCRIASYCRKLKILYFCITPTKNITEFHNIDWITISRSLD